MKKPARALLVIPILWVAVLCVPATRAAFRAQLAGSPQVSFSAWAPTASSRDETPYYLAVARRHPDDLAAQVLASGKTPDITHIPPPEIDESDSDPENWLTAKTVCLNFDRLCALYPRDAWLLSLRLRRTLQWTGSRDMLRQNEFLFAPFVAPGYVPKAPPPAPKPNFSPQELQAAINCAQRGEALEPDNAFFDYMEMQLLLLGSRDAEAWRVLDRAARKTRFDAHLNEDARTIARVEALRLSRSLTPFEKIQLLSYRSESLANIYWLFSNEHSFDDGIALRLAAKAQKHGDHKRALKIYGDLLALGALMEIGKSSQELNLGSETSLSVPNTAAQIMGVSASATVPVYWNSFFIYAKQHGRADLAKQARSIRTQDWARRIRLDARQNRSSNAFGISNDYVALLEFAHTLGAAILLLLLGASASAILVSLRLRRAPQRDDALTRHDTLDAILACGGVRALMSAALAGGVLFALFATVSIGLGHADEVPRAVVGFLAGNTPRDLLFTWNHIAGGSGACFPLRAGLFLMPVFLGMIFCARRAIQSENNEIASHASISSLRGARESLRALTQTFPHGFDSGFDFDAARIAFQVLGWMLRLALAALWFLLATIQSRDADGSWVALFQIALAIGVAGALTLFFRFKNRVAGILAMRLLQHGLIGLALVLALLYPLLLLTALPLETRAAARIETVLQEGELAPQVLALPLLEP